ncbi:MAG: DUF4124 domain-containing protein [Pseudomonadales bacterium]|nr:DUF4124 domain-containing protein [Pseudomonadales bacterium]
MRTSIVLTMFMTLALTAGAGGIYTWVDDQGVAHYADTPPNHTSGVQTVRVQDAPSSDAGAEIKQLNAERDAQDKNAQADEKASADKQALQAKSDQAAKDNKARCDLLQANLQVMNEHGQVRESDPKTGDSHYLSEEEKQKQMADMKKQIQAFCGH